MISYQTKNSWQRPLLIALIGSAVVGTGVWWFSGHSGTDATTQVAAPASESQASSTFGSAGGTPVPTGAPEPAILSDGRPADVAPGVWSALDKAVKNKPALKPEVDKVLSYMRFQKQFEQWQAMEDTRDAQQRRQLAKSILEQMPDRLARGEFSMSESLMMATVLMSDLEPDEKKREQQLDDWGKRMALAVPQPTDDAQMQAEIQRVEDLRMLPGTILTGEANPDPAVVQKALEDRSRISR
ncbi:hypothetical protein [Aquabacterium sp.]|uniref:hypothetical protein n=1 Tax=Aquabacterium sp. TaxID=1872578 RepID=UPI003D6CE4F3